MGASVVAAAMFRAERQITDHLRDVGATSPERAVPLPPLSPLARRRLGRLQSAQVVNEVQGRYWLDEGMYAGYRGDRRAIALVILGIASTVALGMWLVQLVRR